MSAAFDQAQACYDAAEPDDEVSERDYFGTAPVRELLEGLIDVLDGAGQLDDSQEVQRLSDRRATVGIWIDGHEYSLVLNRED